MLQSLVVGVGREEGLDIVDDGVVSLEFVEVESLELFVRDGEDDGLVAVGGEFVMYLHTILTLCDFGIGPGVVDGDVDIVLAEGLDDVDHLRIAHIGAVLLEGKA